MNWNLRGRIVSTTQTIANYFSLLSVVDINTLLSFREQLRFLCSEVGTSITGLGRQTVAYQQGWEVERDMLVIAMGIKCLLDHPDKGENTVEQILLAISMLREDTLIKEYLGTQ